MQLPEHIRLIVLDVDGTLVTTQSGETFRRTAADWQWIAGRRETCQQLQAQGIYLALASNQAGVAFPWSKFSEEEIRAELEAVATAIGADYLAMCCSTPNAKALPAYHHPNDPRRKPGPGMLIEAMQYYSVSPQQTMMVGDRSEDEEAAQAAGAMFIHADQFFNHPT